MLNKSETYELKSNVRQYGRKEFWYLTLYDQANWHIYQERVEDLHSPNYIALQVSAVQIPSEKLNESQAESTTTNELQYEETRRATPPHHILWLFFFIVLLNSIIR